MNRINKPSSQGFSLVEVLIAVVVLAVGVIAAATMIARSTIQDSRAYYMSRASMMMEEFVENSTRSQYTSFAYNNITNSTLITDIDGVRYTMNCAIRDDIPIDRCKEITCVTTWNNKGLQARSQYVYVLSPKF